VAVGLVEGRPQRQQLVQGQAQAVDVAAQVPPAAEPLRGQVAQGADDVAGVRQVVAVGVGLGQAEVGDPDVAGVVEQQVGGLDVAVQHALAGGVGQGVGDLHADAGDALPVLAARLAQRGRLGLPGQADGGRHIRRAGGMSHLMR
jgi:hypothetical protein